MTLRHKVSDYILLYGGFIIYSLSSVFAKIAAGQDTVFKTLLFMGIEIAFLGLYAIVWQQALKKFSLVFAMSSKGVTVIIGLIWAICLFGEKITVNNLIGAALIIFGIWMVSLDD